MKITLLNQCFYPDVVATGQHLTDLAVALAERGHQVTVITSNRGYDARQLRFKRREHWKGIDIVRLPSSALGKTARWRRAIDFATLLIVYVLRLAFTPRQDVVIALTSPPLIAFVGSLFVRIKGGRFVYWIMDLNPDEALAAGWLRKGSLVTRSLEGLQNFALASAESVIALDRFMAGRLVDKGIPADCLKIVPPWPHADVVSFDAAGREQFRSHHQLDGKFLVMYAGNHSPCHPLNTLLDVAEKLRHHREIAFCFVGGGSEFAGVREFAASHDLSNIICLPYQPRAQLAALLSAADLHVVVMGEPFVGIIHPCKIYNVMRVGSPFLYIGPPQSHVMDIVREMNGAARAYVSQHGSVDEVVRQIIDAAARYSDGRQRTILATQPENGLRKMVEIVETAQPVRSAASAAVHAGTPRAQSQHRPLAEDRAKTQLT